MQVERAGIRPCRFLLTVSFAVLLAAAGGFVLGRLLPPVCPPAPTPVHCAPVVPSPVPVPLPVVVKTCDRADELLFDVLHMENMDVRTMSRAQLPPLDASTLSGPSAGALECQKNEVGGRRFAGRMSLALGVRDVHEWIINYTLAGCATLWHCRQISRCGYAIVMYEFESVRRTSPLDTDPCTALAGTRTPTEVRVRLEGILRADQKRGGAGASDGQDTRRAPSATGAGPTHARTGSALAQRSRHDWTAVCYRLDDAVVCGAHARGTALRLVIQRRGDDETEYGAPSLREEL